MRIVVVLCFAALLFPAAFAQQPRAGSGTEMQQATDGVKAQIADLEQQLAAAKQTNPKKAADLEQQLAMMRSVLSAMEGATKGTGVSGADLTRAAALERKEVPAKDTSRIARMPRAVLTEAELKTAIQRTAAAVEKKISPKAADLGRQLYQQIRQQGGPPAGVANAANGLWMLGGRETALYLMGRACVEQGSDTDALNNYAAFLTMSGAEEAALPILQNLNQRFPGNSTVLNNMGQAWLGLGDLSQAEQNLTAAIRVFGGHSQANYAMCLIQESQGNTAAAVQSLERSIRQGYTADKAAKLRKLGGKLSPASLRWNLRMPQDPMGLNKFVTPPYCQSTKDAEAIGKLWTSFRRECNALADQLAAKEKKFSAEADELGRQRTQALMGQVNRALSGGRASFQLGISPLMPKAQLELGFLGDAFYRKYGPDGRERVMQRSLSLNALQAQLTAELGAIDTKYEDEFGEGKRNPVEAMCAEQRAAKDKYLKAANAILESANNETLEDYRKFYNETVYYTQFTVMDDPSFEVAKTQTQQKFLRMLAGLQHEVRDDPCAGVATTGRSAKLADFDDVACQYKSSFSFPGLGTMTMECSRMTTEFGVGPLSGKIKENLDTGEIIKGTLELTVGVGASKTRLGPVSAELGVEAGGFVEFDKGGVTDFGGIVAVKAGAATEIEVLESQAKNPTIVEIGVEGRYGWNSGPSIEGKGLLSNL